MARVTYCTVWLTLLLPFAAPHVLAAEGGEVEPTDPRPPSMPIFEMSEGDGKVAFAAFHAGDRGSTRRCAVREAEDFGDRHARKRGFAVVRSSSARSSASSSEYTFSPQGFRVQVAKALRRPVLDVVVHGAKTAGIALNQAGAEPSCHEYKSEMGQEIAMFLEPGEYTFQVGFAAKGWAAVALREADTPLHAFDVILANENAATVDRVVPYYHRAARVTVPAKAFLAMPRTSWRYVRHDLDAHSAVPVRNGVRTVQGDLRALLDGAHDAAQAGERPYPREGEPVVPCGAHYLTADGLEYEIDASLLSVEPVGAVRLPTTARAPQLSLYGDRALASPGLLRRIERHRAAAEKIDACYRRTLKKKGGFASPGVRLLEVTSVGGEITKVENYGKKVSRQASIGCGVPKHEKAGARLLKELEVEYVCLHRREPEHVRLESELLRRRHDVARHRRYQRQHVVSVQQPNPRAQRRQLRPAGCRRKPCVDPLQPGGRVRGHGIGRR